MPENISPHSFNDLTPRNDISTTRADNLQFQNRHQRGSSRFPLILVLTIFLVLAVGAASAYMHLKPSKAQPATEEKTIIIGIISLKKNESHESSIASMKKALISKGYNNIRYLQDNVTEISEYDKIAKKYVDMNVDVIVTNSTPAVKAAMKATSSIPIVFGGVGDPVLNGVVPNMESSEKNVTGISSLSVELTRRRLSLYKQINPKITKVYIIHQPGEIASDNGLKNAREEAKELKITLIEKAATISADLSTISSELKASEAQAIAMSSSSLVWGGFDLLIEAQNRERIPLIGTESTMAKKGPVLTYGPSYIEMGRQIGDLVAQVLSGTKPQYIPIQRPEKLELIISKKAADNIGLTIPSDILKQADAIIE
jgi:putative ABC transport system substrate-binding protein